MTTVHAEAVETFLAANGIAPGEVTVIGFHGQTLLHRPERGLTVQIGDGQALAARVGSTRLIDNVLLEIESATCSELGGAPYLYRLLLRAPQALRT